MDAESTTAVKVAAAEQEALKEGIILDFSGETSGTYFGPGGEQKKVVA